MSFSAETYGFVRKIDNKNGWSCCLIRPDAVQYVSKLVSNIYDI